MTYRKRELCSMLAAKHVTCMVYAGACSRGFNDNDEKAAAERQHQVPKQQLEEEASGVVVGRGFAAGWI
jgi:hypothetical protein